MSGISNLCPEISSEHEWKSFSVASGTTEPPTLVLIEKQYPIVVSNIGKTFSAFSQLGFVSTWKGQN